jgi:hypothetical protein
MTYSSLLFGAVAVLGAITGFIWLVKWWVGTLRTTYSSARLASRFHALVVFGCEISWLWMSIRALGHPVALIGLVLTVPLALAPSCVMPSDSTARRTRSASATAEPELRRPLPT